MPKKRKILFVDDEVRVLNSLRRSLMDEDFHCVFAKSGDTALSVLEKEDIAVIVTDMKMPEMNGLQLLRQVEKRFPKVVKIILSGYAQFSQVITTINQVDVFKYIMKPWSLEEDFLVNIYKAIDYYNIQEEHDQVHQALGIQNQSYTNILKSLEIKLGEARESGVYVGRCSLKMLQFNIANEIAIHQAYRLLYDLELQIYEHYLDAFVKADESLDALMLLEDLYGMEEVNYFGNRIKTSDHFMEHELKHATIIKVLVYSHITLYKDLFVQSNNYMTADINSEGYPAISFVMNRFSFKKDKNIRLKIDLNIQFINQVLNYLASMFQMEIRSVQQEGNIVASLIMKEAKVKKQKTEK